VKLLQWAEVVQRKRLQRDGRQSAQYNVTCHCERSGDKCLALHFVSVQPSDVRVRVADESSRIQSGIIPAGDGCNGKYIYDQGFSFPELSIGPKRSKMSVSAFRIVSIFPILASALQTFDSWGHERIQLSDVSIHFRYSESGKPPLLLVHGFPEHSRTWETIGPILAENYTVICPDNRGTGDSSLSATDNYTAPAGGEDLRAILDFLNITKVNVMAHDKGVGLASSLAIENQDLVNRIILIEYPLPGFGYPTDVQSPSIYRDWQLAFFAVPV